MGFLGAIGILLIVLKLANVIMWSWWIVLLPSIVWLFLIFLIFGAAILAELLK